MNTAVFFCGYHGVGKTYTANALLRDFDAKIVDCGPIIRRLFSESRFGSFGDWAKHMEDKIGAKWDDILLLEDIKKDIGREQLLFVVGNRDIETILFLARELTHEEFASVIYFEKPTRVIKRGYETRMGVTLTDEEFERVLHAGPDAKLESIKKYVLSHPDMCMYIYEDGYSDYSIAIARDYVCGIC